MFKVSRTAYVQPNTYFQYVDFVTAEQRERLKTLLVAAGDAFTLPETEQLWFFAGNVVSPSLGVFWHDGNSVVSLNFDFPEEFNFTQYYGKYYGFTQCCIDYFQTLDDYPEGRKLEGTGYIPCDCCNEKTEQELLDVITANRKAPDHFNEDKADWIDELFYALTYQP